MKTLEIKCNDQSFILHPLGVAYWNEKSILLIADVHLGKVTHFRKHGSAVPQNSIYHNFNQLQEVVSFFKPKTVCFLGDLFHSSINNEWLLFKKWVKQLTSDVVLVSGNHDIIATNHYDKINISVKEEWKIDSFLLTHYPQDEIGFFNFSGHIHPGVELFGFGRQRLKLSCFYKKENQMIFPAFGNFTGNFIVKPTSEDKVFVNTADEVVQVY
ncbi:ligase-associated DNA damage response endonuclease PdeM [Ulvibacter antarcticus]|uniref:Putative phosphoesterase n=1 Tax=Ulvibacter antarcticus TaxID=442714 RepID=A0A3L9Z526_9FLAO|nr:ligase-associated DNA damage response endonuclease PdeM [Ulvibacter antarcticus]RMA66579.1 putative phosphoesterase [Ulvibacter antarcticus]